MNDRLQLTGSHSIFLAKGPTHNQNLGNDMTGFMRSDDFGKMLLRLSVGGILLFHGVFKLSHGVEWIKGPLAGSGLPASLAYGAYVGEIIAPVLIILGYRTRIAALLVLVDMLMAVFLVLRQQIFAIKEMGGGWAVEIEAFFLLTSLAVFFMGGGKLSVTRGKSVWD